MKAGLHPALKRIGALLMQLWLLFGAGLLILLVTDQILKAAFKPAKPALVNRDIPGIARDQLSLVQAQAQYWKEHDQAKEMRWRSFVYFRRAPFAGSAINIDAHGFRKSVRPANITAQTTPLWIFGASTIWGTGVGDAQTLPSLLNETAQGKIDALNFGESGYVSLQSAIAFQRALGCAAHPKVAVFVDGVNDVYSALQHGKAGLPQNEQNRVLEFNSAGSPKDSARTMFDRLEGVQRLRARLNPNAPVDDKKLVHDIVEHYLHTTANTRAIANTAHIRTIFIWQPSLFSKAKLSSEEQSIVARSELRHQQLQLQSTQLLKARVRQLGLSDMHVLDALFDSYPDSLYFDFSHTTQVGNQALATWIWNVLRDTLEDAQAIQIETPAASACVDAPVGAS